jgi:hypothetical protein
MGFAVADEKDRVAAVADIVLDMMLYPAGICHPAGRDDDEGFVAEVEEFGFFDSFYIFQSPKRKGVIVGIENFLDLLVEILRIMFDDLGGSDAEGAVDIVVEGWKAALLL